MFQPQMGDTLLVADVLQYQTFSSCSLVFPSLPVKP